MARNARDHDGWLVDAITSDAGLAEMARLLALGESYGADGPLLARRYLQARLETGAAGVGEGTLRKAASRLTGDAARALRAVADTSGALGTDATWWRGLYLGRPRTVSETSAARLLSTGQAVRYGTPRTGADGTVLEPAWQYRGRGQGGSAVIVNTHADTAEIVTGFEDEREQADWLADRTPAEPGEAILPLVSSLAAPRCRAVDEEAVIARLIQDGDPDRAVRPQFGPGAFSAYARAAIYRAWTETAGGTSPYPRPGSVRAALGTLLLRAPYDVAVRTGWPYGGRALAYFDRLTVTPVDKPLADASAHALARQEAEARARARRGPDVMSPGRTPRRLPQPRHGAHSDGTLGIPRPPDPGDDSPGIAPGQGGR
jgi:hypothetical protein